MDLKFISIDEIRKQVYSRNITVEMVYKHFDSYDDEALYIVDNDDKFYGVITPGDYYRKISNNAEDMINRNSKMLNKIDYDNAKSIITVIKGIHEVPVVIDGVLIGVISNNIKKSQNEWFRIRAANKEVKRIFAKGYFEKKIKEIVEFIKSRNSKLILVEYPTLAELGIKPDDFGYKYNLSHGMEGFTQMTELDKEMFYGSGYYPGAIEKFADDYNEMEMTIVNGYRFVRDIENDNFSVKNGHRNISNGKIGKNRIYLLGMCNVLGSYVGNDRTIGYYLQQIINRYNQLDYEVYIYGKTNGVELDGFYKEELGEGDYILYFVNAMRGITRFFQKAADEYQANISVLRIDKGILIGEKWLDNFYNSITHHNHLVNEYIANFLFDRLDLQSNIDRENVIRDRKSNYYISPETYAHFEQMREDYDLNITFDDRQKVGAIVMNCNPFTLGHRYLIEQAVKSVSRLYIFVVEEDKSTFKFKDRFEMVKQGVRDIDSEIIVLPSTKYIISNQTFSQYFDKEKEINEIENPEYDIRIFGEVVCKIFGIGKRFAGEEPIDVVTNNYNRTMERILPEYDVEFVEIPRLKISDGCVISATTVRKLIKNNDVKELERYLPASTIDYLKQQNILI